MKISKRARTIILWGIAIGLLLGMVISFTPTMGFNFGGQEAMRGTVQMTVNGAEIREAEVLQARQGTLFNTVSEGPVARQLDRLMVDELVRQAVLEQAAAPMRVSNGEVRQAVDDFRESRGVAGRRNDTAYLNLIRSSGFNDETFREYLRDQLRLAAWEESVVGAVEVTDSEVEAYYQSHLSRYQSDERIVARHLVVGDAATAEDLRARAVAGEAFADLVAEHGQELADRGGAVGAAAGESEPRPVGRAAFPTAVANAAFALRGAGLTEVIEAAGGYHVVQVLDYLPADTLPFEEVRDRAAEDALEAKRQGAVEAEIARLRESAVVAFPPSSGLSFTNEVVAQVGEEQITEVELDRATYTNPTIQQALSPETADLIVQLFRPAILDQLIDTELAYQGAADLGIDLVGSKNAVAQAALDYVARDVTATDEQISEYYESNVAAYTVSAEANVTQVEFADAEAATAFRASVAAGQELAAAAAENGGETTEHGRVLPGSLEPDLDTALFGTDAFDAVPGQSYQVSDVLVIERPEEPEPVTGETDDAEAADEGDGALEGEADLVEEPATVERYVVLVAQRTPETVRPLEDVRAQVENAVLATNRQQAQQEWLAALREQIEVREFVILDIEDEPADAPFTVPEGAVDPGADDVDVDAVEDPSAVDGEEPLAAPEDEPADAAE